MNPLKPYTELGDAVALGIVGGRFPWLFQRSNKWSCSKQQAPRCGGKLGKTVDWTVHFTEATAITRTPGLLICYLNITETRHRERCAPARQRSAAPYRLQTDQRTSPLKKTGRLTRPRFAGFTFPSLAPSVIPHQEQTQRKLVTLGLGFHSCPRLTLKPLLPGKLIKRTINPHKNPKPTPKL